MPSHKVKVRRVQGGTGGEGEGRAGGALELQVVHVHVRVYGQRPSGIPRLGTGCTDGFRVNAVNLPIDASFAE